MIIIVVIVIMIDINYQDLSKKEALLVQITSSLPCNRTEVALEQHSHRFAPPWKEQISGL